MFTASAHPPCRSSGFPPRSASTSARWPRSLHAPSVPVLAPPTASASPFPSRSAPAVVPGILSASLSPSSPPLLPSPSVGPVSARSTRYCDLPDRCRSPACWPPVRSIPPTPAPLLSSSHVGSSLSDSWYAFSCRFRSFLHPLSASMGELIASPGTDLLTLSL